MKAIKHHSVTAVAFFCVLLLSGCEDVLMYSAQLPGLRGVSDRMNDRAIQRMLSRDPLQHLNQNIARGDYRFLGLEDWATKRQWVPGVAATHYKSEGADYLIIQPQATWRARAEQYAASYNKALVSRRQGKKLRYGFLVR